MRCGVVARADQGGLAAMTFEAVRHLRPERVLVMLMGPNQRGTTDLERYVPWCDELFPTVYRQVGHEAERFLDGLDVVWTAETFYDDRLYQVAKARRVKVVVHVMPELYGPNERFADTIWNPTVWAQDRLPAGTPIVPVPIALDVLPYRNRQTIDTLFCTTGEAMCDRNGAATVVAALPYIERPVRLLVRGGPEPGPRQFQVGQVEVEWLPPAATYDQVIPDEADVLLLPRRYGGLSMPMQEAAARGVLPIVSRLSPQDGWFGDDLLVPARPMAVDHPVAVAHGENPAQIRMKGGPFPIYDVDPRDLATRINWLASSKDDVSRLSAQVRDWAFARSWDVLEPVWRDALERAAG